jgi:hypothetical protein
MLRWSCERTIYNLYSEKEFGLNFGNVREKGKIWNGLEGWFSKLKIFKVKLPEKLIV